MLEDVTNPVPYSSFQRPIAVPASDPNAGTFHYAYWSDEWTERILGALLTLVQQATWDTDDPAALYQAQAQSMTLIEQLSEGIDMFTPGMIMPYAGSSAPTDWLLCDGSAVSRTTYADLFTVISTLYGVGDGSTTFNVPDLRGRAPISAGSGSGLTPRALATTGGEEEHQLTTAELASHAHSDAGHAHSIPLFVLTGTAVPPPLDGGTNAPILTTSTGAGFASIQNTGGDTPHNNMQPWLALNYIIRAVL